MIIIIFSPKNGWQSVVVRGYIGKRLGGVTCPINKEI